MYHQPYVINCQVNCENNCQKSRNREGCVLTGGGREEWGSGGERRFVLDLSGQMGFGLEGRGHSKKDNYIRMDEKWMGLGCSGDTWRQKWEVCSGIAGNSNFATLNKPDIPMRHMPASFPRPALLPVCSLPAHYSPSSALLLILTTFSIYIPIQAMKSWL